MEKNHLTGAMHAMRHYGRSESMNAQGRPGVGQKRPDELGAEYRLPPARLEPKRSAQAMTARLFYPNPTGDWLRNIPELF